MAKETRKRRGRLPVDPNLDVRGMLDIERDVERETDIFKPDSTESEDVQILRLNEEKSSSSSEEKEGEKKVAAEG